MTLSRRRARVATSSCTTCRHTVIINIHKAPLRTPKSAGPKNELRALVSAYPDHAAVRYDHVFLVVSKESIRSDGDHPGRWGHSLLLSVYWLTIVRLSSVAGFTGFTVRLQFVLMKQ